MSTLSTSSLRPLYKASQVRELDQRTIAGGIESFALMQRAASSAWHSFRSRWPQARSVTVLCGGGNNGGEGGNGVDNNGGGGNGGGGNGSGGGNNGDGNNGDGKSAGKGKNKGKGGGS